MQSSVAASHSGDITVARVKAAALPWYCYAIVFAAACIPIGSLWDISWHSTIGRDSFWTPAHMVIYVGGALPGFVCGWIVFKTSFFATEEERARSVRYLGFHGPLGAWVCIWGSLTMLISAPFDNWWHDAYGLDVEILSPPHTLLALGMYAVAIGAMLLVLSWQNRGDEKVSRTAGRLFLFSMGVLVAMASVFLTEKSYPNAQHAASFYRIGAVTYAFYLSVALRASRVRWGATWTAAGYMLILAGMVWILPRFKAEPLLAPIYLKVDHMVPPVFPLILIVPAFFMDLLNQSSKKERSFWRDWALAAALAVVFTISFVVTQWNFSSFLLLSKASHNWFFAAGDQWPYFIHASEFRDKFWHTSDDSITVVVGLGIIALALLASRGGLAMGSWMSKVRR
jgi:hypothetical protein